MIKPGACYRDLWADPKTEPATGPGGGVAGYPEAQSGRQDLRR